MSSSTASNYHQHRSNKKNHSQPKVSSVINTSSLYDGGGGREECLPPSTIATNANGAIVSSSRSTHNQIPQNRTRRRRSSGVNTQSIAISSRSSSSSGCSPHSSSNGTNEIDDYYVLETSQNSKRNSNHHQHQHYQNRHHQHRSRRERQQEQLLIAMMANGMTPEQFNDQPSYVGMTMSNDSSLPYYTMIDNERSVDDDDEDDDEEEVDEDDDGYGQDDDNFVVVSALVRHSNWIELCERRLRRQQQQSFVIGACYVQLSWWPQRVITLTVSLTFVPRSSSTTNIFVTNVPSQRKGCLPIHLFVAALWPRRLIANCCDIFVFDSYTFSLLMCRHSGNLIILIIFTVWRLELFKGKNCTNYPIRSFCFCFPVKIATPFSFIPLYISPYLPIWFNNFENDRLKTLAFFYFFPILAEKI